MLGGTLRLKYHTFPFARRKPNWRLSTPGHVVDILTAGGEEVGLVGVEAGVVSSGGSSFLNKGFRRFRITKKTPRPIEYGGFRVRNSQSLNITFMPMWRWGSGVV